MGGNTGSVIIPLGDGLAVGLSLGLALAVGVGSGVSVTSGWDTEVEQPATARAAANPKAITAGARPVMSDSMP